VLVVDDDPISSTRSATSSKEGHRVARARHGVEALGGVEAELPAIIC
jgi:CheY-like chemotaxis protein